jgi:hypothetical protein
MDGWSHRTRAIGQFKQPHILYQKDACRVRRAWAAELHAMRCFATGRGWSLICVMFLYQDARTGRLRA